MLASQILGFGACALLLLMAIKRLWLGNKAFFRKYTLLIDGLIFGGVLLLLGYYFYDRQMKTGMAAVALGGAAMSKYLYDKNKEESGDENPE